MAAIGGRKAPIAVTVMRPETLADVNRGSVRGWVLIGAGVLVVFAVFSWPDLLYVAVCLALAVGLGLVAVVVYRMIPDAEVEARLRAADGSAESRPRD